MDLSWRLSDKKNLILAACLNKSFDAFYYRDNREGCCGPDSNLHFPYKHPSTTGQDTVTLWQTQAEQTLNAQLVSVLYERMATNADSSHIQNEYTHS